MRDHKNIIVTLMYNKWELTNRLLVDLSRYEAENIDEIVIVDNGSKNRVGVNGYERWKTSSAPISFHRLENNIGFTLGANYGLKIAQGELAEPRLVFLISNDVEINGKFINQAEDILLGAKRALVGNRHINWDSGWNKFSGKVFDYLEGYFLAMTSDGWRDVGYFDPKYAPCDFEDVDLSTKAKSKGYKLVSLNNPLIVHAGAGTYGYNPEREAITKRNQKYFQQKWMPE